MARLSVAAVLLLVAVPLCIYTCALLLVGVELGRAVERRPDTISLSLSVRGVLDHVKKELLDVDGGERVLRWAQADDVVPASHRVGRSPPKQQVQPDHRHTSSGVDRPKSREPSSGKRHYSDHTSQSGVIGAGPWGGPGGQPFDHHLHGSNALPRLRSIVVYHSYAIHSLAYEYQAAGDGGATRIAGPWGLSRSFGNRAARARIQLDADEHVTAVEGTTGRFGNVPGDVVTSLTFRTSAGKTYGPYGDDKEAPGTAPFYFSAADGGCVGGFWGRAGWLLDAVGVYLKPSCFSSRPTPAPRFYAEQEVAIEGAKA
ncbi:hypothetical protein ACP4OV_014881 [Aristida adscensionis]